MIKKEIIISSEPRVQPNRTDHILTTSTATVNQDAQAKPCVENISFGNIKEKVNSSNLPDTSPSDKEEEHTNKLKVLNNYRNFGNMYFLKNNHKKAEWAYKNGIKQAASSEIKSKEQLRSVLMAEVEFRFSRAKCLFEMGSFREARNECDLALKIDKNEDVIEFLKKML